MLNDYGTLTVRTVSGGAYPVKDAIVRIIGAEESNRSVAHTLITDIDGLTPTVILPAPIVNYSLSPDATETPYSTYNLEIDAIGYFPKRIYGIMIFPTVDSLQQINMIPTSENGFNAYPGGNINAEIPGMEDLN